MVVYRQPAAHVLDQLFGALADRTRRDILARVMDADASVSELAAHYDMSFAAVQKHVAVLERARLVTKRRAGRAQRVAGAPMRCVVLLDCSHSSISFGRNALVAWTSSWPLHLKEICMPVVEIRKDPKMLTMTVIAQFAAPVVRVWAAYADPRQLERFWGPPAWPAKFERHDFTVGGRSEYVMTGPSGEQSRGFWEFLSIDQSRAFEVKDGFLGPDGNQAPDMPTMRMRFTFEPHDGGTRMLTVTTFPSLEALEKLLGMGMEEGMKAAMAQIDGVLAA